MPPPSRASTARANDTPSSGGCKVATSAADTAACWANICPDPSSSATVIESETTTASCHQPSPSWITSRSATAIPSVTPRTTSTARRPRSPCVSPSVIIAETGAKNGWSCPTISVATSHASVAASVACRIARAAWRSRSARMRADSRERSAASSIKGCARAESVRGGSSTAGDARRALLGEPARASAVDAAALAAPRVAALLDRDGDDQQADQGIEPPGARQRVAEQPDQERAGQVGAKHVLAALPRGRRRAELVRQALLRRPQQGHQDHRPYRQPDPDPARLRTVPRGERADRLVRDVRREQEELDRDELLRAPLGRTGEHARAREAPDDHDAREALDRRVEAEPDERDRAGGDAGRDRHRALDGHPREREPGQQPHAPRERGVPLARERRPRRRQQRELQLAHTVASCADTASTGGEEVAAGRLRPSASETEQGGGVVGGTPGRYYARTSCARTARQDSQLIRRITKVIPSR